MYIVGNISTGELVERCGSIYKSAYPSEATILANVADRNGGSTSDYAVYFVTPGSNDAERIFHDNDLFEITWSGDTITGVDFTTYDTWKWIGVETDKLSIKPDNTEKAIVTYTMYKPDGVTVDKAFNGTLSLDTMEGLPSETVKHVEQLTFESGIATLEFKSSTEADWRFLYGHWDKANQLKIKPYTKVEVKTPVVSV